MRCSYWSDAERRAASLFFELYLPICLVARLLPDKRSSQNGACFSIPCICATLRANGVPNLSRTTKVNGKPETFKVLLMFSGRNGELHVKIKFYFEAN